MPEIDPAASGPDLSFWIRRFPPDAFSRIDESPDREFYATTRSGSHLDSRALGTTERVLGSLITEPGPVILDLMAGSDSHLPAELRAARVVGLGLDEAELRSNPELTDCVVHDLNASPALPFADASMDVVLNTLSVGYLTRPFEVFAEVARVLKPGGLCLVVFSNRMFHPKAVKIWRDSTGAERKLLVEDYLVSARAFERIRSFVSQGRPRPPEDKYAGFGIPSDPVWAVYADRRGAPAERPARPAVRDETLEGFSPAEIERRKRRVKETLRCPHCDQPLQRFTVPDSPFCEWPNDYMYVCFNNDCPYLVEGWQVMNEQGNAGFSYRLMYNPAQDKCVPVPLPSVTAARQYSVNPRG